MNVTELRAELEHPSFLAAASTFAAYAVVLLGITAALFGLPYLLFSLL